MTLAQIRTVVKDLITHTPSGIDTTVDTAINTAIEFMTHSVSLIYDEEIWQHQFDSADTAANQDNWQIPANTQYIRKAAYRDVSGTEDTYTPLRIVSPDDLYDYNGIDLDTGRNFVSTPQTDFSGAIRLGIFEEWGHSRGPGRVDAEGEPRLVYRMGDNVFVHPRPSSTEVDNWLELFLIKYCASLSTDGESNNLTTKFPYAVIHYAVGVLWATKFNNLQRAQASIQLGASMLNAVATKQEISKLINLALTIPNS